MAHLLPTSLPFSAIAIINQSTHSFLLTIHLACVSPQWAATICQQEIPVSWNESTLLPALKCSWSQWGRDWLSPDAYQPSWFRFKKYKRELVSSFPPMQMLGTWSNWAPSNRMRAWIKFPTLGFGPIQLWPLQALEIILWISVSASLLFLCLLNRSIKLFLKRDTWRSLRP